MKKHLDILNLTVDLDLNSNLEISSDKRACSFTFYDPATGDDIVIRGPRSRMEEFANEISATLATECTQRP